MPVPKLTNSACDLAISLPLTVNFTPLRLSYNKYKKKALDSETKWFGRMALGRKGTDSSLLLLELCPQQGEGKAIKAGKAWLGCGWLHEGDVAACSQAADVFSV